MTVMQGPEVDHLTIRPTKRRLGGCIVKWSTSVAGSKDCPGGITGDTRWGM